MRGDGGGGGVVSISQQIPPPPGHLAFGARGDRAWCKEQHAEAGLLLPPGRLWRAPPRDRVTGACSPQGRTCCLWREPGEAGEDGPLGFPHHL